MPSRSVGFCLLLLVALLMPAKVFSNLQAPVLDKVQKERSERVSPFSPGKKILHSFVEKRLKKGAGRQNPDKKLSKLALAGLYCSIGALGLSLIASLLGVLVLSYLSSAAMLAAIVLCILVLLDDDQNKASRNLAKALLIVWGAMLLLGTVLLVALLTTLGA